MIKRVLYLTSPGCRPTPVLEVLLSLGCTPLVYISRPDSVKRKLKNYFRPWSKFPLKLLLRIKSQFERSIKWDCKCLRERCNEARIPIRIVPGNGRLDDEAAYFAKQNIDLVIINNYPRLIGSKFLWQFPRRVVNFHSSLLPKYRGMNQSLRILANLESMGGVTLHYVDPGTDTGNIIDQESFELTDDATPTYYSQQVAYGAARLLVRSWERIEKGYPGVPQNLTEDRNVTLDIVDYHLQRQSNRIRRTLGLPPKRI